MTNTTAAFFAGNCRRRLNQTEVTAGTVSGITRLGCEVRRSVDESYSEIYLTYRNYGGVVTEILECGTGKAVEDEAITDTIKTFLELRN